ncbi:MAG TPA: amidohydrolase family protein [Candidatus Limnocylindria bacterium]|nr:amidohydrolase family protein [Candidatus Limnocylindria bacterium]
MTVAVRASTLIDGTGADPVRGRFVVIEDGVIQSIATDEPRGAEVIDTGDLTVLPGLIDCHVHLAAGQESIQQRLLLPPSFNTANALVHARETLDAGFTTVRDAGFTTRGVKLAVELGLFPGPRMRIAVTPLSQTGGHGDSLMPSGVNVSVPDPERPVGVVDGIDNIRRVTREVLRAGADQIKIMTSGGVLSPNDEPGATGFSPEEIAAVVYEAHAAGKTVMSHAQATQGIKNAVVAGVESIEHGIYLTEEICAEMKKRGTFLVATLVAPQWVIRRAEKDPSSLPPYAVRKAKEVVEAHQRSFRMAVEMGVRIAMGTDTGVGPHGTNAEEIALMVENGMTPLQALVATTKTAAECARVDTLVGTIEPGKRADLVGVRGDPLANIALFKDRSSVAFVMKDGIVHLNGARPGRA